MTKDSRLFPRAVLSIDPAKISNAVERSTLFKFSDSERFAKENYDGNMPVQNGAISNAVGVVDRLTVNAESAGHSLLVAPTIFNIAAFFKPTMDFVAKVEERFLETYYYSFYFHLLTLVVAQLESQRSLIYLYTLKEHCWTPFSLRLKILLFNGFTSLSMLQILFELKRLAHSPGHYRVA
jgi:hypothetical protein